MTLTLELAPEVERVLEDEAQSACRSVADVAAAWLEAAARARQSQQAAALGANGQPDDATGNGVLTSAPPLTPRQQAARRGYGMLKGSGHEVDDFLAERRAEAEREMEATAQRIAQPAKNNEAAA